MLRIVARDRLIAVTTPASDPEIRVMSAASMATSVPVPMAIPTSAAARAGASLIPSPTMPTVRPSAWRRRISLALWSGSISASTRLTPLHPARQLRRLGLAWPEEEPAQPGQGHRCGDHHDDVRCVHRNLLTPSPATQ